MIQNIHKLVNRGYKYTDHAVLYMNCVIKKKKKTVKTLFLLSNVKLLMDYLLASKYTTLDRVGLILITILKVIIL